MNASKAKKIAVLSVFVALSMHAIAQTRDATQAAASPALSSQVQAKQVRTANRALQKKVRATLAKTKGLDISNIIVRARGGDVILEGAVPEVGQIDLAGTAAQAVPGVNTLKNTLTIHPKGD